MFVFRVRHKGRPGPVKFKAAVGWHREGPVEPERRSNAKAKKFEKLMNFLKRLDRADGSWRT